ncbi:dehydrogenase/reductase SDR family member 7-like isoform X2 [Stegodyphus dumicola]|uniref:dehydrogenase/reductase SDR family member 7-like isoform X2 n=1 Tax=Stegodyphus dumicola TaxID=202533 RepID=UPI0015A9AAD6|nr:dehydrogenase/reductase SDR family member 7-like isoform X2 [Stegodyphus dumicola]
MLLLLLSACFLGFITLLILFLKYVDADLTLYYYDYLDDVSDRLRNKVIWITGASSGLGEYLAYELAKHGNKLILSGTNKERLESVKAKCSEIGLPEDDILVLPFNMTDYDVHEECFKKVLQKFEKLDVLVNNAGRSQRANFEDIDISVDKELFNINVFATLNLTRKVLPHFLENKSGHFVVTSSCVGKMGAASSASYTASKHALHKFGKPTLSTDRRMPTDRCGRLMAVAIAHKVDEAWICIQPCLIFYYLAQYTPTFFRKIIIGKLYTADRAEKLREGRW